MKTKAAMNISIPIIAIIRKTIPPEVSLPDIRVSSLKDPFGTFSFIQRATRIIITAIVTNAKNIQIRRIKIWISRRSKKVTVKMVWIIGQITPPVSPITPRHACFFPRQTSPIVISIVISRLVIKNLLRSKGKIVLKKRN